MEKQEKAILGIYDYETGVIVDEIYEGDSYKKLTKEQKDFLNNHKQINQNKEFNLIFINACNILSKESLTPGENRILWGIQGHIEYETGILKMRKGRNADKILTAKELIQILDMNEKTFYRAMDGLTKKKIIGKTKIGRETNYIVNPFIFYKGQIKNNGYVPTTTYELFKTSKWNTNND